MKIIDMVFIVFALIVMALSLWLFFKIDQEQGKCLSNAGQYLTDNLAKENGYPVVCTCVLMDNQPNTNDLIYYSRNYGYANITLFP